MTSKTRYAVKFGNVNPIPVEKVTPRVATLTRAVDSIRARIDVALAELEGITSVRQVKKSDFKSPMVTKKSRNLVVRIGYGQNNHGFAKELEGFFDCPLQARAALIDARQMLSNGEFDADIEALLAWKREIAALARAKRSEKAKVITYPVVKNIEYQPVASQNPAIAAE